ncbi:FAAH [Acanthosepion pharaonis]|uniref:fatty acid amide hydrolase n=1 Tax=Acanthosepion pharaonis TaxID=158019 RepID=A0A812DF33_ACAPH|nr:FAAH [Sepia pharaonis]
MVSGTLCGINVHHPVFDATLLRRIKIKQAIGEERNKRDKNLNLIKESLLASDLTVTKRCCILSMDIDELQQALQTRKLKALEVLQAFQSKALETHERVNCIVQPILEAEELAKACDSSEKILGPLHGIPISLKENIPIKGHRVTCGVAKCLLNEVIEEDSLLVKMLKNLGAVPFVRTNVPQTLLSVACDNNIYGATGNPYDPKRSSGGSSGGEAALIGSNGSILGIGSDVGGSIRIPSHYCGTYGLKATSNRLTSSSTCSLFNGQSLVPTAIGPMGPSTKSLIVLMKALLSPRVIQMDSFIPSIPFQTQLLESKEKLRIGYYLTDPLVTASPASQRAVLVVKKFLEANGHTLVEFNPPRMQFAIYLAMKILMQSGKIYHNAILHENAVAPLKPLFYTEGKRIFLSFLIYLYDPLYSSMMYNIKGVKSSKEWYKMANAKKEYCREFQNAWQSQQLDAIICPSMASASAVKDQMFFTGVPSYTLFYNLLDYPAGVLPVTKVTKADSKEHANYKPKHLLEKFIKNLMNGATGLPIGIQCVAPPYKEELVLRLMIEIEEGLKKEHTD